MFQEFYLERIEDESGVSGLGIVAHGIVIRNGWCVLTWLTQFTSVGLYPSLAELEAIHGHNGKTLVRMGSPPEIK